jgi:thiol-disulfide isomerase/thioredoxin
MVDAPLFTNLSMTNDFVPVKATYNTKERDFQLINNYLLDKPSFLVFHKTSCPACNQFMNTLNELKKHSKKQINIGLIDISDKNMGNDIIADYFDIQGVPSIVYHNRGIYKFVGMGAQISASDLISYMNLMNNPGSVYIQNAN